MTQPEHIKNNFGQPVGRPVPGWSTRGAAARHDYGRTKYLFRTDRTPISHLPIDEGICLQPRHAKLDLFLPIDPPQNLTSYEVWLAHAATSEDPLFHVIHDGVAGRPAGIAAFLRIDPVNCVIEVTSISLSAQANADGH